MAPQPLSSIYPTARLVIDDNVPEMRPQHTIKVARAISIASSIEAEVVGVFAEILGAEAGAAAAIYKELRAASAKRAAIDAVAKHSLSPEDAELFSIVQEIISNASGFRNRAAHWLWAFSDDLPDKLLLVDPSAHRDYMFAWSAMALEIAQKGGDFGPLQSVSISPSDIWAYSLQDIDEACNAMHEAEGLIRLLRAVFSKHERLAEPLRGVLIIQPLIVAARKRRQKSQTTKPLT